jgi:copper chaperone CopZ
LSQLPQLLANEDENIVSNAAVIVTDTISKVKKSHAVKPQLVSNNPGVVNTDVRLEPKTGDFIYVPKDKDDKVNVKVKKDNYIDEKKVKKEEDVDDKKVH